MISGLRGTVNRFGASSVYLETGGVEYEIHVSLNVFDSLSKLDKKKEVFLYVHHQFLQDDQRLFGFLNQNQKDFFKAIQNVKGLGSSLALSILSHLSPRELLNYCENKDIQSLTKIPRVGNRTAEMLVFEVNRNIVRWKHLLSGDDSSGEMVSAVSRDEDLVVQALLQLGYKEAQIRSVLKAVLKESEDAKEKSEYWNLSEWIHRCLRIL